MFIAENFSQFKNLFVAKLKDMLSDDELGAFILVLANSQQDNFLKAELDGPMRAVFLSLKEKLNNNSLQAPQDDVDVFDKISSMDIQAVPLWQNKSVGDWEITFNSMRKLRPARASSQAFDSIRQPFDENKFHFNKPFLKPEILWQGEFNGKFLRVLYNKFPFSDYHLLIAACPEDDKPQLLTQSLHEVNIDLVNNMAADMPGFGIGYNSLAAGASVNHLHCQGFIRRQVFPIEKDIWSHNGGEKKYPLVVRCFTDKKNSWVYLTGLLERDVAFNCVYRQHCCYVITRRYQGSVDLPEWLTGAGWLDVAGVITVSDELDFREIDEASVTEALTRLAEL